MGDIEETKHTKLTWVINNGQNLRSDNTSGVRDVLRAMENGEQELPFKRKHIGWHFR